LFTEDLIPGEHCRSAWNGRCDTAPFDQSTPFGEYCMMPSLMLVLANFTFSGVMEDGSLFEVRH
jgi:hypothetical protein